MAWPLKGRASPDFSLRAVVEADVRIFAVEAVGAQFSADARARMVWRLCEPEHGLALPPFSVVERGGSQDKLSSRAGQMSGFWDGQGTARLGLVMRGVDLVGSVWVIFLGL